MKRKLIAVQVTGNYRFGVYPNWGGRLSPYLRGETQIDATENVKSVHFTPVFRGEMTWSIRVCVCVCSSEPLFKG